MPDCECSIQALSDMTCSVMAELCAFADGAAAVGKGNLTPSECDNVTLPAAHDHQTDAGQLKSAARAGHSTSVFKWINIGIRFLHHEHQSEKQRKKLQK